MVCFRFLTDRRPADPHPSGPEATKTSAAPVRALLWSAAIAALGGAGFGFFLKAQLSTAILMPAALNGTETRQTIRETFPPRTPATTYPPSTLDPTAEPDPSVGDRAPDTPPEPILSDAQTLAPLTDLETDSGTGQPSDGPSTIHSLEDPALEPSTADIPDPSPSAASGVTGDPDIYPPPVENPPEATLSDASWSATPSALHPH